MSGVFDFSEAGLDSGLASGFPVQAIPESLQVVSAELAQVYQTPVSLPAMCAVAVLSGAVGKSVVVRGGFKDRLTRLNLYVVPVAERGSGKGVIGDILARPLMERSETVASDHRRKVGTIRAEAGVLKHKLETLRREAAKVEGPERELHQVDLAVGEARLAELERQAGMEVELWTQNTTSEALGCALADNNETIFSYSAEAGAAVQVALGRYNKGAKGSQGDFDLLLSGYSGDAVKVKRVGRKVQLDLPCVALLWLVQKCVVDGILGDPEAVARGLTARLLIFDSGARREHDNRQDLRFTCNEQWARLISRVLDRRLGGGTAVEIECDPAAREVFACFHDESVDRERMLPAALKGELSRWRENAIKVGGLFALAGDRGQIAESTARGAVDVVRWCGLNYLGLLAIGQRENCLAEVERIERIVRSKPAHEISLGELARSHGIPGVAVRALVEAYPERVQIQERRHPDGAPGRPGQVVVLADKSTFSNLSPLSGYLADLVDLTEGNDAGHA